jgi:prepilin-type N-terminal cleavage/methylation domain-containing protein
MKRRQNKTGVTLVEILVVVAIIAILVTMVIGIAARIDTQGKERLTKNTIALLTAALGEFGDYGYSYTEDPNYAGLKFPPDCNNFDTSDFGTELGWTIGGAGTHDANYSGSEAMYFFLSRVPESRQTLDKIDKSMITSKGSNGADMTITIDGKGYPLLRIIDPWRETLRYSYYKNSHELGSSSEPDPGSPRTFPVITSAGPDKEFGSADDIRNR